MNEHSIVRSFVLRIARDIAPNSATATRLMGWGACHETLVFGGAPAPSALTDWGEFVRAVEAAPQSPAPASPVLDLANELGRLLRLSPFDARLLTLMIACDRLPIMSGLVREIASAIHDLPAVLSELSGASADVAARQVRSSEVLRLGLVSFVTPLRNDSPVQISWPLSRILDRDIAPSALAEALAGKRQAATLALPDFSHFGDADYLVRLLSGAVREKAHGVNILIHGPPGTGKTELARTLAEAAGCSLHGVGESDDEGFEPSRHDRVLAVSLALRVLGDHSQAVILFDEMEDLIGDQRSSPNGWLPAREGSKVFVNRLLETNAAPIIWVTNVIGAIDDAILRRMSHILRLDHPPRRAAHRILERIVSDEQAQPGVAIRQLIDRAPEVSSVLKVAVRAARLAGDSDCGTRSATSLVRALRGGDLPVKGPGSLDLELYQSDRPIDSLFDTIREQGALDVSLLLSGAPGTGKTALAHHLAQYLDRPLLVRRASDLLSKWLGETEQNIAGAFAEARRLEGVLLLDEADSLLFDRTRARNSWEIGQVNEMLTWLDRHPFPVVAATNHLDQLDPATLRRFVFKLELKPLGPERLKRAFERFFGMEAPAGLVELRNLTPGDFAVVARQRRFTGMSGAESILEGLRDESRIKPDAGVRIGF